MINFIAMYDNPFADKGKIIIGERYIPRELAQKTFDSQIVGEKFGNLSIYGERNVGKTTFVRNCLIKIIKVNNEKQFLTIWYNVDLFENRYDFLFTLIDSINTELDRLDLKFDINQNETLNMITSNNPSKKRAIFEYFRALGEKKIRTILVFDEFDAASKKLEKTDFYLLKNISTDINNDVAIITISKKSLKNIQPIDEDISNFYDTFHPFEMQEYNTKEINHFLNLHVNYLIDNLHFDIKKEDKGNIIKLIIQNQICNPLELDKVFYDLVELKLATEDNLKFTDAIKQVISFKSHNHKDQPSTNTTINSFNMKSQIYISYAWKDRDQSIEESREEIVNRLCETFEKQGYHIMRDKADMKYRDVIRQFMNDIAGAKALIAIISEKYLKSPYCMYELTAAWDRDDFRQRIFPIILPDAEYVYDDLKQIELVTYWEKQYNDYKNAVKSVSDDAAKEGFLQKLRDREFIFQRVSGAISTITGMAGIPPAKLLNSQFNEIIKQVEVIIQFENDSEQLIEKRIVNQFGDKSIYIENNQAPLIIN